MAAFLYGCVLLPVKGRAWGILRAGTGGRMGERRRLPLG